MGNGALYMEDEERKKELMLIEYLPEIGMYRALNSFIFQDIQYRPGEIVSKIDIIAYLRGNK